MDFLMDFLITIDIRHVKFLAELSGILAIVILIAVVFFGFISCINKKDKSNKNSIQENLLTGIGDCFLLVLCSVSTFVHSAAKNTNKDQLRISYHLLRHMENTARTAGQMHNQFGCYPTSIDSMVNKNVLNSSYGNSCNRDNVINEKNDVFDKYSYQKQEYDISNLDIKPFSITDEVKTDKTGSVYVLTGVPENIASVIYDVCLKSYLNIKTSTLDSLLGRENKYNFLLTQKDRDFLNKNKKCAILKNGDFAFHIG